MLTYGRVAPAGGGRRDNPAVRGHGCVARGDGSRRRGSRVGDSRPNGGRWSGTRAPRRAGGGHRLLLFGRHRTALPRRLGGGRCLRDRGGRSGRAPRGGAPRRGLRRRGGGPGRVWTAGCRARSRRWFNAGVPDDHRPPAGFSSPGGFGGGACSTATASVSSACLDRRLARGGSRHLAGHSRHPSRSRRCTPPSRPRGTVRD